MNNIDKIYEVCEKTFMKRFYYKSSIPEKKIINARKAYPLPDSEKLIALCDSTISGNGKNGLAICASGVFLKNMAQKVRYVTWDELSTKTIAVQGSAINVGNFRFFVNNGQKEQTSDFLKDIQKVLIEENKDKGGISTKINRLYELCGEISMKYYCSGTKISSAKIMNVKKTYLIPDSEKIIALFDESESEKVGNGIVICQGGLYVKNALLRAVYIPWEIFIRNKLEVNFTTLLIGGFKFISTIVADSGMPQFMQRIQNILLGKEDIQERNVNASTSEDNVSINKIDDIESRWKIAIKGEMCGTFDKETLKSKINSGEFKIEDCYAWKPGMSEWLSLLQIQELKDLVDKSFFEAPPLPKKINNMSSKSEVETEKIDINNCSLDELLTINCMNLKNSKLILDKRKDGVIFNSPEDVQKLLDLKPHQVEEIVEKVIFNSNVAQKQNKNSDRKDEVHSRIIDY